MRLSVARINGGGTMIGTEQLFLAAIEMRNNQYLIHQVKAALESICQSTSYMAWKDSLHEQMPFVISESTQPDVLRRLAFVDETDRLLVKINKMESAVFVTDGVWVPPGVRVFPFCDESAALLRYVRSRDLHSWAEVAIDLATGCGHTIITIGNVPYRIGYDINPRAIAYATLNRVLNGLPGQHCLFGINDVRDGIPRSAWDRRRVLLLANMPFGPNPSCNKSEPLTSNGGQFGTDLQQITFKAIAEFAEQSKAEVRVVMLGLSAGNRTKNRWDLLEKAHSILPSARSLAWKVLSEEKVFRIDGKRQIDNPGEIVEALTRAGSCHLYYGDDQQPMVRNAFFDLARLIAGSGFPDLAYGMIEARI